MIFTIVYTNFDNFIPSHEEFFPIVYAQSLPLPLPTLPSDKIELQQQQEGDEVKETGFWSGSTSFTRYHSNGFFQTADNSFSGPIIGVRDINGNYKYRDTGSWTVSCNDFTRSGGIEQPYSFSGTVDSSRIEFFEDNIPYLGARLLDAPRDVPCFIDTSPYHNEPSIIVYPNGTIIGTKSYSVSSFPGCENTAVGCIEETTRVDWILHPFDNNNNPPNPIIDVSPSNAVESGTTVTLDGSRSNDPDGDEIINHEWKQVDGPPVNLIPPISTSQLNGAPKTVQFIAPQVSQDTILKFTLSVTDSAGQSALTATSITIKPQTQRGDFSITCLPGAKVLPGGSDNTPCYITSLQDFNRQVDLTCEPPIGEPSINCSITPSSLTPPPNGNVPFTLTITTTKDTPLGHYNIILKGRTGIIEHSIIVPVECDICFKPRTQNQDTSLRGEKFIKSREGYNGDGSIKRDCGPNIRTQCHVTHDKYGLYQDSTGACTKGYGDKIRNGQCTNNDIKDYNSQFPQGMSELEASTLLSGDINREGENPVNRLIQVKLTQEQFDALVSLSYNIGQGNFAKSLLRMDINNGICNPNAITEDFLKHITDKKGNVLPSLIERRNAEAEIFNEGTYRDKSGNIIQ